MKQYYGLFLIENNLIEFKLLEDIQSQYSPIYHEKISCDLKELNSISSFLDAVTNYLDTTVLSKKKKMPSINYSLIIDDVYAKNNKVNLRVFKEEFDLSESANDVLNENIKNSTLKIDLNYCLIGEKAFLYEIKDLEGNIKQYSSFPKNKKGEKLYVSKSLLSFPNDTQIVSLLKLFAKKNINFDEVLTRSQCLNVEKPNDKFKLLVNFKWDEIIFIGSINNIPFYYEVSTIKKELYRKTLEKTLSNVDNVDNKMSAVMNNWKIFKNTNVKCEELDIYNFLVRIIDECVKKTLKSLSDIPYENIEVVLTGKSSDFVLDRFKTINQNAKVMVADNIESKLSNVDECYLGATFIASKFKNKRENSLNTINTLPIVKNKGNWFKRMFSWMKPSYNKNA